MRRFFYSILVITAIFLGGLVLYSTGSLEEHRFSNFCTEIFCDEIASNTLSMHYLLKESQKYIPNTISPYLGSYSPAYIENQNHKNEKALASLNKIHRDWLSDESQHTYDLLSYSLEHNIESSKYYYFHEPLTPIIGAVCELPILLSEYTFYQTEDVNNYLSLLSQTDTYMESIIEYEEMKREKGLTLSQESADSMIEFCQRITQLSDNHFMVQTFTERLEDINLTPDSYHKYTSLHEKILNTHFYPAYEHLRNYLQLHKTEYTSPRGLINYPNGLAYYKSLIAWEIGCTLPLSDIEKWLDSQMVTDLKMLQLSRHRTIAQNIPFQSTKSMLEHLQAASKEDYPSIPDVSINLKDVSPSLSEYLSPAFYLTPPIDDFTDNTIYLNKPSDTQPLTLYTTLAHEGWPGHLYQNVYNLTQSHHPVRSLLYFGGYVEGWATYAEQESYFTCGLADSDARFLSASHSLILNIYAHLDLYVHGYGWDEAKVGIYLKKFGITNSQTIHEIYLLICEQPSNYLKYYLGCLEIVKLKEQSKTALGSKYSPLKFHIFILENGPAPFPLLDRYWSQWCSSMQKEALKNTSLQYLEVWSPPFFLPLSS